MGGAIEGGKGKGACKICTNIAWAPVGRIRWRLAWWRGMCLVVVGGPPTPFLAVDFSIGGSTSLLSYSSVAAAIEGA
jgi:hypothetical protein